MKKKGTGRGVKRAKSERQKRSFKRAYLSRAQAARRLQVTNAEFERLVILKGIYPREPNRFKGSGGKDKTYFYSKDILWLEREPMLQKMREFSSFKKKLTRLKHRRETFDAQKFEETHKPSCSLSTIIKERYPTFQDALRDCDDALTHIFLYAALPPRVHSSSTIEGHTYLTSGMSEQCKAIRSRWLKYTGQEHCLRKAFISIKGIYYEANVKGVPITWQCPYEFTSKPPKDVVYRVLMSFLEFYLQLMRFILFKLEHDQRIEAERKAETEDGEPTPDAENFPVSEEEEARQEKIQKHISLFKGLVFYVSREVPKTHMSYLVESFSGSIADSATAEGVTHYIIDRPAVPTGEKKFVGIEYVQPQWLFDCINAKGLLPVDEYLMGKALPPHISPFRISISNDPDEVAAIEAAVTQDRRILTNDIPDRVHEIRRMLDPTYNKISATADVHLSDEDDNELDDEEHRQLVEADEDAATDYSSDTADSEVKETIERSTSAKKRLKSILEKGDNKPTDKAVAEKKKAKLQELRENRNKEGEDSRRKRKLEETKAKEDADREFKSVAMPTKSKKLWKAMQFGIKNREKKVADLEKKREQVREGDAEFDSASKTLKIKKPRKK